MLSRLRKLDPSFVVLLSFALLIAAGTALLRMPFAATAPTTWLQAAFTATSAVCVTGLTVVDTGAHFTPAGQCIIMILIQLGGLGIITLSVFFLAVLRGRVSIRDRLLMQEALSQRPIKNFVTLLWHVLAYTAVIEAVGAAALYWQARNMPLENPVFFSVFHAVSAFNNAGFGLLPDNFTSYNRMAWTNAVITALIILGGLGFLVLLELEEWVRGRLRGRVTRLSLYSKLVLRVSLLLLVTGTVVIACLEWNNQFHGMSWVDRCLNAWFLSVNTRTAGFNMVDTGGLTAATLFFIVWLMFIGGSPASTAGGIKTTTLGTLYVMLRSRLLRREHVEVMGRTIRPDDVTKALSAFFGALAILVVVCMMMLMLEYGARPAPQNEHGFLRVLFEVASALGTVGLSTGITAALQPGSQALLMLCMFIGRVGPLTVALTAFAIWRPAGKYKYPEEGILIG